jgi:Uncharacterised protein family (UPF0158)
VPFRLCKPCIGHGRRPTEPGSGRRVSPGRWIPGTLDILLSPSPADRGPDPRADYPDGVPDLSGFDLDEIAAALADQDSYEHAWLVNPDTGEIVFWTVDTGIDGQTPADLDDLDEQGLIGIRPLPSWVWYQDMADFAGRITDERAGRRLGRAIDGRGAFRRFRAELNEEYPGLRLAWHAFRDARAWRRAVEWLADNELIRRDEAARYLASHPDPDLP